MKCRYASFALLIVAMALLGGCAHMPLSIPGSGKDARLSIQTTPPNAIVYLRARSGEAGAEYWAVGTTPFEGEVEQGFWDLKIESVGYQAVEVLVRARPGKEQSYDLYLVSSSGHRWKSASPGPPSDAVSSR